MSTSSPARSRCSSKQKHCTLLKYDPALLGCTLYVATPVTGEELLFFAVKNASVVSPGRTLTFFCVGVNRHGIPSATSALKLIVTSLERAASLLLIGKLSDSFSLSSIVFRRVVPPNPVAWQNMRYSGTDAYVAPTMPTVSASK